MSGGPVAEVSWADTLTPDRVGCLVGAARGDDSHAHRRKLMAHTTTPGIPGRKNRTVESGYDNPLYRWWRRLERFFGNLKVNRRRAVRYEKTDVAFLGFIALAAALIHLC